MTGASAGIGRAFATTLAAAGYAVTAVARREDRLAGLLAELGPGHDHLAADLTTRGGLQATVERLTEPYTLLVNNAGVAVHGGFAETSLEDSLTVLDLNCRAVVTLAHAFLASAQPGAALVNVSSTLGRTPKPGLGVYSATKAFVTSFSETLWHEQKARGVHVLALCPGVTRTESQGADGVPSWLVQTPEDVAARALRAVRRREGPTIVSGRANAVFTAAAGLLPRRTAVSLLA
ncbi:MULTISPECIES: SDR family NAD(P)-dependent oxidoreductase [Amycolatopsis]|uniref:SDR family NAD(P)-dependent oxidoreductase n=1 Tax=Amycolatopsis TaxID=1813 RepID=UPI001E3BB8CC|nr:SDR family NAD(P)-dependent oxidoreductase [Amycolatopsis bullii]